MIIGRRPGDIIFIIIIKSGSPYENNIRWLFNISYEELTNNFSIKEIDEHSDTELNFASRFILSELGIEITETDENYLESMIQKFDDKFPKTYEFSEFARNSLGGINEDFDPDQTLIDWMDREELLFRTFENHLINEKIKTGFSKVDSFIEFSLSIQNRRKSRAGYALENHFEQILHRKSISYSRGKETENRAKPDFIFPGIDHYRNFSFPVSRLTMLGVKSTCKDRWRQILSEASRVQNKHLLTLEPGISDNQTLEMKAQNVQLVIPQKLFNSYNHTQQHWLINIKSFLDLVQKREL